MPTDYLADLMKQAKESSAAAQSPSAQGAQGTQSVQSVQDAQAKNIPAQNQPQIQIRTQPTSQPISKSGSTITLPPEEREEEIAQTVQQKDMDQFRKAFEEAEEEPNEMQQEFEGGQKEEVKAYGKVKIYKITGKPLLYYFVPTIRPTAAERRIINTIKEATTRLISIAPYKIRNLEERRIVYKQKIIEIINTNPGLKIPQSRIGFYADAVVREMVGYGLIDDLIKDDFLEEIMVVGPKKPVYVFHREFEMMTTNIEFFSEQEIEDLINKIAREVGRRVDVSSPLLDARLVDGSRVNATIPPASISGGTLTIRKFKGDPYSIIDLIRVGTISAEAAAFLWICVEGMNTKPANMLIAGGTGSGKTTLLNVLASFIPERERIITIEDTAELSLPLTHWIRLESKPPGLEGTGELRMDILTKNSLRMRPDRVLVGEIRHEEAFTLFTAMNTGHDGCLGTVHANSPDETLIRLTTPPMNVPGIMMSGLDLIILEHRYYDRKKGTIRRVSEIAELYGALEGKPKTQTVFQRDPVKDILERTLVNSSYIQRLESFTGMTSTQLWGEVGARQEFLQSLLDKNIRSMSEVSKATKDFLIAKRELGDKK